MKVGDIVIFQYEDEGVVRHSTGEIVGVEIGGKVRCRMEHTNFEFLCMPWAIRPVNFSHASLRRKLKKVVDTQVRLSWSGSLSKEDAEEAEKDAIIARSALRLFIDWLKY